MSIAVAPIHRQPAQTTRGVNHIAFSPQGTRVANSRVDMRVEVREGDRVVYAGDFATENEKVRSTERVRGLRFSPDGRVLYVAAGDRLSAIDLDAQETAWEYTPPRSFGFLVISPMSLSVSPQGLIASSFDNGSIAVWNPDGRIRAIWHDNDAPRTLGFLADGRSIVGTDSFSLCVWDIESRQRTQRIRLKERAFGLAVSPSQPLAAVRTLRESAIYDLTSGDAVAQVPSGSGLPLVAIHPQDPVLALGDRLGVDLTDFEGRLVHEFDTGAPVLSLAFSPDGGQLLIGCADGTIRPASYSEARASG